MDLNVVQDGFCTTGLVDSFWALLVRIGGAVLRFGLLACSRH